jgi:hypothetical protein
MKKNSIFCSLSLSFFILFLFSAYRANAESSAYFKADTTSTTRDTNISVELLISSDVSLNVCSFLIAYSPDTLEFLAINTQESVIGFLKTATHFAQENAIKIEGGSIKPFSGNDLPIAKLIFKTLAEGNAVLEFKNAECFKADGSGTPVAVKQLPLKIKISSKASEPKSVSESAVSIDTTPPSIEDIRVFKNPIDEALLLDFRVQDPESGIKTIAVRFKKCFSWSDWKEISPPAALSQGIWQIEIKAVDNYGNSNGKIYTIKKEAFKKAFLIITLAALAGSGLWLINRAFWRKKITL